MMAYNTCIQYNNQQATILVINNNGQRQQNGPRLPTMLEVAGCRVGGIGGRREGGKEDKKKGGSGALPKGIM